MKLIGVDVGGTFTDLVLSDTERDLTVIHKVPTTPADPSAGVLAGIRDLCERHGDRARPTSGTSFTARPSPPTPCSRTGARAPGMVTSKGYRDIIHVGRHQRPEHYSIMQELPWQDRPLVQRRHRKGVSERIAPPRGEVLVPLDEDEVREAARALKAEGVEAIAVCFLFSYIDPRHEERAREIIAEVFPEAFVTTSAARVAAVPRVRALHHRGDERLHRAQGEAVREPPGRGAGRLRARRRAAHHGLERRRGHAGHGGREARAHAPVRARRRACSAARGPARSPAGAGSSPSTSAAPARTSASSSTGRSARPRRATRGSPAIPSSSP